MKRRDFIKLSFYASLFTLSTANAKKDKDNYKELIIPPLNEGVLKDGIRHYDMQVTQNNHVFFDGYITKTYGINTSYLGETIKLTNKENVSINYTNNLDETITMHGHGMHIPASQDGTAHQRIFPKTSWSSKFTVNQKACTNWYHSHQMEATAKQVYMGLAGLMIIEDDEIKKLDLPHTYGEDDIPLVIQDRYFDRNRQLYYNPGMRDIMMGYNGNIFISNGVVDAYKNVEAKEIRFRILNGSNSSVYKLAFDDERTFMQIATDNSLLETPVELYNLILSPGERAEIVVDFSDDIGQSIHLYDRGVGKSFLKINVNKKATSTTELPDKLTTLEKLSLKDVKNTRFFKLSGMRGKLFINGLRMDMKYINEKVPLNDVEVWEIKNTMMMTHNFHIHATHFMVIERNGKASGVLDNEKGYKDTVRVPSGQSVKFVVKMTDYKDETTPYMYHCHFLEHEDAGMMGQFVVV